MNICWMVENNDALIFLRRLTGYTTAYCCKSWMNLISVQHFPRQNITISGCIFAEFINKKEIITITKLAVYKKIYLPPYSTAVHHGYSQTNYQHNYKQRKNSKCYSNGQNKKWKEKDSLLQVWKNMYSEHSCDRGVIWTDYKKTDSQISKASKKNMWMTKRQTSDDLGRRNLKWEKFNITRSTVWK